MTKAELLALVEAAEGADREIDGGVYTALECIPNDGRVAYNGMTFNPQWSPWLHLRDGKWWPSTRHDAPTYSASIDAALALAERVLPGVFWHLAKGRVRAEEPLYGAQLLFGCDEELGIAEHPTSLALAIVAATLRALIAQEDSRG